MPKKRKWSKEECRIRYVQGEAIGQRALAGLSGRAKSVIGNWCSQENWVEQRDRYKSRLRAETENKTIEKTSELLSDELSKRNEDHVKGFESFRAIAIQFNKALLTELQSSENKLKLLDQKSMSYSRYAMGYKMAVDGERKALGMEYLDLNYLIEQAVKAGYDVVKRELPENEP